MTQNKLLRRFVLHILFMVLLHSIFLLIGLSGPIVLVITFIEVIFFIVDLLRYVAR